MWIYQTATKSASINNNKKVKDDAKIILILKKKTILKIRVISK